MEKTMPLTRMQQAVGFPEHPCEAILRNSFLIAPYEEMEVQFFENHCGLYHVALAGEPFSPIGFSPAHRSVATLLEGYLPVVVSTTETEDFRARQTVFATLLEGSRVVTGKEDLILMVRWQFTSKTDLNLPVKLQFANCFEKQREEDLYWKEFLKRDDIRANFSLREELPEYPFPLESADGTLSTADGKIVMHTSCGGRFERVWGTGSWAEGTKCKNVWCFTAELKRGKTFTFDYALPYLPLAGEKLGKLKKLTFPKELSKVKKIWKTLLSKSSVLSVPGTQLENAWKAQAAYTFIMMDRQNKGDKSLYGGEMIREWSKEGYPDKILTYPHLSPSMYEFIWAQESSFFVLGALDLQGYHEEVERGMEVFFELQGKGTPGVHDPSVLPDKSVAASFMGTTPHAWLNSNGGVLHMIALHFRLTRNAKWILRYRENILKSCRWIKLLRATTKAEENPAYRGLMPRGQSTDATFASSHFQSYYTDVPTYLALREILPALRVISEDVYREYAREVEDYRDCLLRSIDLSVLLPEEFEEDIADYDYSAIRYQYALPLSEITAFEPNGVPTFLKNSVFTKSEAQKLGLKGYISIVPQIRVPLKFEYLDIYFMSLFGMLSDEIDFTSDEPIRPGGRVSGKLIWEIITEQSRLLGFEDVEKGEFNHTVSYIYYNLHKMLSCNEQRNYTNALRWFGSYCEPGTYVMMEDSKVNCPPENWWVPSPFALSMASYRHGIRNALINEEGETLVIGKLLPFDWIDNMISTEKAILFSDAPTYFGKVSLRYQFSYPDNTVTANLVLSEPERFPARVEVRFHYPADRAPAGVTFCGAPCEEYDRRTGTVTFVPQKGRRDYQIVWQY